MDFYSNRFLLYLLLCCVFFASFIVVAPTWLIEKTPLAGIPVVATLRKDVRETVNINKETEIILLGDVMLGRTVMTTSLDKNDPTYPWQNVTGVLSDADLILANLENPIVKDCPRHMSGFKFCADPRMTEGLTFAGVDIVNLANNHTMNYGQDGLDQTKNYLEGIGISYTGTGSLLVHQFDSFSVGFLGFDKSEQSNPQLTSPEEKLVKESNEKVDVLVVSMHWGVEYENTARPGIRNLAVKLVELGADMLVGHHPHWVQNTEVINGVPVYYSLGNFVFDQMWSEETRRGLAIKLTLDEKGNVVKEEKLSTYMREHAKPEWVE